MVLSPGTRFGSYEIVGPLGAGGMGEVYRARDTSLGRDVAIKVLPAAFAQDAERLARFEREARVLASLNHPNIATLYCIEPVGDGRALVMELVEGAGLGDVMRPGSGMRAGEAIAIARQIADALDAAHERGIVHRDLKPANIRLTADGVVKVLDFGLAKSGAEELSDLTNSPTVIGPTASGVVLGTAPYMSPEQARGKLVDKRTDIWAFGCVLYEMLAGRRAFTGETSSDTIAAILEREPDWSALPAGMPAAVRHMLQRCLEKDPKRRLRDIADARADLDQRDTVPTAASGSRTWLGWATAALMTVIAIALLTSGARTGQPDGQALDPGALQQLTLEAGVPTAPSLSADGRLLAYASKRSGRGDLDIWLQQMAGGSPIQITDDLHDDTDPDLSADGTSIVFRSERDGGGAFTVPALGGPARLVAPEARTPRWSPDGRTIAYWTGSFRGQIANSSSVFILPLSGGAATQLMADFEVARDPVWSPDGRALLILALRTRPATADRPLDWWYAPLDGSAPAPTGILDRSGWRENMEQSQMTAGPWRESRFLLAIDGGLWSVPLTARGALRASPRALVFGAGRVSKPTLSRDDQIVFAQQTFERVIERAPITTADAPVPVLRLVSDGNRNARRSSVTRDGATMAYETETISGREIWLKDLHSGVAHLFLSVQSRTIVNPTISRDGTLIGFTSDNRGNGVFGQEAGTGYVVNVGGGVPRKVCEQCLIFEFTADNGRAVIHDEPSGTFALIDLSKGTRATLLQKPATGSIDRATLSPDGRWLAFRHNTPQDSKNYLVAATGHADVASAERIDEPTSSGRPAGWSPDSRVLYLLLDTDGSRCLWGQRVDPVTGRLVGKPYVARHFHELGGNVSSAFGNPITAQGFFYETLAARSNLWRLIPPRDESVK